MSTLLVSYHYEENKFQRRIFLLSFDKSGFQYYVLCSRVDFACVAFLAWIADLAVLVGIRNMGRRGYSLDADNPLGKKMR